MDAAGTPAFTIIRNSSRRAVLPLPSPKGIAISFLSAITMEKFIKRSMEPPLLQRGLASTVTICLHVPIIDLLLTQVTQMLFMRLSLAMLTTTFGAV